MIYNKIFKQKERSELIDLLSNRGVMNYNAKSALLDIVQTDEFFKEKYPDEIDELKAEVENDETSIASFDYLKYLGFRISQIGDTIKVTRLSRFYMVDLLGVLIGALLAGIAYFGLAEWKILFTVGVSIGPLVISLVTAIIAIIGIMLLVRSLSRYLEFSGFEIVRNSSGLMIRKRNDILVESVLVKESSLDLVETEKDLSLIYRNDNGDAVNVIRTSGGMKVRKTLVHLKNLLSNS